MRRRIVCKCGSDITTNVFLRHVMSERCLLDNSEKNQLTFLLKTKELHKTAWLIAEADEAIARNDWYISVFENKTSIDDWKFSSPRPKNHLRPSSIKKFSIDRTGANNPACRSRKFEFSKKDVQNEAVILFKYVKVSPDIPFSFIERELNTKFKDWKFLFADFNFKEKKYRGFNRTNQLISSFLKLPVKRYIKLKQNRRGYFIQQNLKNNEVFLQKASKLGSELFSRVRISQPQKILFEMVKLIDENTSIEYKVEINGRWKSFDIYSPMINAFIEMHGRSFHDINKTTQKLMNIVIKNVKNDDIKKQYAESNNKKYIVFWDDETQIWENEIKKIFNIDRLPKRGSYEKCKSKVLSDKTKRTSL